MVLSLYDRSHTTMLYIFNRTVTASLRWVRTRTPKSSGVSAARDATLDVPADCSLHCGQVLESLLQLVGHPYPGQSL